MVVGAVAVTALTSCSGSDANNAGATAKPSAAPTLESVQDIPDIVMIDTDDPWPQYVTAQVNTVQAGVGGTSINVNYQSGPDLCSGFAGYAVQRIGPDAAVTVVVGRKPSCTGDGTTRSTVLPLAEPLGTAKPTVSRYSQRALPIK